MREHLYRGKRADNGEWVYGYFAKYMNFKAKVYSAILIFDEETGDVYSDGVTPIEEETICEYTGLTDKNGTKIFEGDIVQASSNLAGTEFYIGTIEFGNFNDYSDNIYTGFFIKWKNVPEYSALRQSIIWWRDEQDRFLNIIGNIYDNHELLKSEVSE